MKSYFDYKQNKQVFDVSENEKKEIEIILTELKPILNNYIEDLRINLDEDLHPFITNENIRRELAKIKYYTITELYYNEHFTDIVFFKNGFVEFTKTDKIYEFISAYNVLDDTFNAQRLLQNILKVKTIDWLIENYYKNDNAKSLVLNITKDLTILNEKFCNDIFKDIESENLFNYILKNTSFTINRKFINSLYLEFSKYLDCTHYKFAEYWNSLTYDYKINLNEKSKKADIVPTINNEIKQDFEHLITEFNNIK